MLRSITRLKMAWCAKCILLCICSFLSYLSYAQPANDNCSNAEVISISNSGYGTGVFTSSNVNIGQATVQTGENFAPAVTVAVQDKKSIWFKFTLPTTRQVRVTLQQPGAVIQAGDVGFAVWKTSNCLPGSADLSTKLTPIATFGNTFHPCVDSGVYLVQVSSKAATAGQLSIQIETSYPTDLYDRPAGAYAFGTLTNPTSKIDFSVECQSLEDGNEVCNTLSNYQQYTKSTWHTFKTPNYFDYLSVLLASPVGGFTDGLQTFGYRLYKGDVRTGGMSSLVAVSPCDSFRTAGYTPDYQVYKCGELETATTYTIQLFYKNSFNLQDVRLAVAYGGTALTKAPEPIVPGMATSNQLGVLPASAAGVTTSATDYLACNSRHSLHPCGDALPATGLLYNTNRYNLSTFYTFTLATASNIVINASPSPCGNPPLLIRLYQQSVNNNCATLVNTSIASSALNSISLECLPAGNYTVQISGRDTAVSNTAYYYSSLGSTSQMCLLSNLGQQVSFSIRVNTVQALNRFALQTTGAFDKINNSNALINGTTYQAVADTFGCSPTVLSDTVCTTNLPKAMYRQFVIADSGLVGFDNLNYYFLYKLYKGDADALTTTQNKHAFPDRFTGLTPYSTCLDYYQYCQPDKVCVTAGTYTFTTFGNTNYVNNPDRPTFKFEKITTAHYSPATAQNMGSILDSAASALISDIDYFSCSDNAVPINGYNPCTISGTMATKAIYRQFYLKTDAVVSINGSGACSSGGSKTLFSGKATDGLAGLQPLPAPWRCFSNAGTAACVPLPAGWYTVVSYGIGPSYQNPLQNLNSPTYSSYVGLTDRFSITVTPSCTGPKYNRPYKAAIDVSTGQPFLVNWPARFTATPYVNLPAENFNCTIDTPFITGRPTCVSASYNRITYYVFRVAKATAIQFSSSAGYYSIFSVYPGDVRTDSVQMRTAVPLVACASLYSSTQVCSMQPGTYTLIIYSDNNTSCNYISPVLSKPCNEPLYNRPYRAAIDTNTNQPFLVDWGPRVGHTAAYPKTDTTYNLYREYFNCQTDTPFLRHPIPTCNTTVSRVAYYVFRTVRESYVQINTQNLWGAVYARDVRSDSTSFPTTVPVQPCLQSDGFIQLCRLPAGTYTLVIFAAGTTTNCTNVTPTIYIDQPGYSRFDHAAQAYDFGTVPPDSTWRNGKVGDVNPLNSGRAPSNDFFYCTTGARPADPTGAVCNTVYVPSIYGDTVKYAFTSNNINASVRRNLWYTFVTDQGGTVRIRVNNKTIGANKQYQYRFAVYKSNVAGTLPFSTVVSSGQVDSTLAQGLSFVVTNTSYSYCWNAPAEVSFYRDPCNNSAERYYILVENTNTYPYDYSGMQPNSQAEVSILIDSVNSIAPRFDHYSQAGSIPVTGTGTFTGPTDNFSCASRDVPDPVYASLTTCTKNLWYKFTNTVTGNIQFRVMIGNSNYYDYQNIQLFRQVIPGDSTANGLQYMPYATTVYDANNYWGQTCITPGTYYLLLPGCSRVAEYAYPQIKIVEQAGDFCTAPVVAPVNGSGQATATVTVNCHTIGTDYGEFNPTLTCPANTTTSTYKSSWFRVDISGTDTLDITAYLNENTSASSSQIKYRMMTGNCGAMQEQSCVQDALTQNTYKCLVPGSYFFQVFTPLNATGTIDLKLSAVKHADTCAPVNNCLANANFQPQFDCTTGDSVRFVNYSTYGNAIQYSWNFNYNGQTSTAISPSFFYPAMPTTVTYNVTLTSTNTGCGGQGSVTIPVMIPGRPYVNLGKDTSLCNGSSITLNATSHTGSTYLWSTGATTPTISVSSTSGNINTYSVRVTYNGCIKRDTIKVFINPITGRNQSKIFCRNDSVSLSALRSYGETYLWSTGSTSYLIYASTPGTYYCDVMLNGCVKRDTFNVTGANFSFGLDTAVCMRPGQPYVLRATTAGAISYQWQNNSTTDTFGVTTPGQYWVRINFGTCTVRDTININALQPVSRTVATTLCAGQTYTLPNGTVVSTSGIYRDTLRSVRGCDSVITTTTITLKTLTRQATTAAICQGQTYTLPWGTTVAVGGIYGDTLRSPVDGCDSLIRTVTLTIRTVRLANISAALCPGQSYTLPSGTIINTAGVYQDTVRYASGGCDSLVSTITLAVGTPTRISQSVTVCAGQSYTLPSGTTVLTAGVYADTLRSSFGCDSLITTVNLAVRTLRIDTANATICAGQTYTLPSGLVVGAAGTYRDTLRYAGGCDSIHTLIRLMVKPVVASNVLAAICAGQSYTLPSGMVVNTAGIYKDTLRYTAGCDSLITTANIRINAVVRRYATTTICAGQSYTLPSGTVVNTTGIYLDTLHYAAGCDSLITTVSLTLKPTETRTLNPSICAGQSYTLPNGTPVNLAGIYYDTLRYAYGCDSVRLTIHLSIGRTDTATINTAICVGGSYTLPSGIVVNTAGTYYDTLRHVAGGCDSIRYAIQVAIRVVTRAAVTASICTGQSYTLPSGTVVTTTGIYPDTLRYAAGCDSLITTFTVTAKPVLNRNSSASICAGQSYTLPSGAIVNSTGIYSDTLRYTAGCDSVITIANVQLKPVSSAALSPSICAGQNYTLPSGTAVTTAGIYRDTLHYVGGGCDSVRYTINLTVRPVVQRSIAAAVCAGQLYTLPSGLAITTAGIFRDTVRYVAGCDSLVTTLNLTIKPLVRASRSAIICAGQVYTLPSGALVNATGTYADTLRYVAGCDSSISTINLTVRTPVTRSLTTTICQGSNYVLPSGTVVTVSGTYTDTLRYLSPVCDSIITTVNVTVVPVSRRNAGASICAGQSYTLPSGNTVSASGIYFDTLRYAAGCDSVITTTSLTVKPLFRRSVAAAICAGQPYTLPSGTVVNAAGTYQDTVRYVAGCDSIINTIALRVSTATSTSQSATVCQGQVYALPWGGGAAVAGTYSDTLRGSTGCDSIITHIVLTVRPRPTMGINPVTASVCKGDSIKLTAYGGTTYRWIQGNSISSPVMAATWVRPQASGPYRVAIYDPVCNLTDTFQSLVTANPLPVISITKSNEVTCMQGSSQLVVRGGSKYSWWPATGLNNTMSSNPLAAPVSTTVYHVKVISDKSCSAEDSIELKVIKGDAGNGFPVPSAFTPNGDGNNDCFGIRNWGAVTNLRFNVYDRWGLLVFSTADVSKCWDGTYKRQMLDPAAFVYIISADTFCGPVKRKGTVVLVR